MNLTERKIILREVRTAEIAPNYNYQIVNLSMGYFVHPSSIVRTIWGSTDVTLFIFAGAAAEFALNKEVDWLFFTGRLPADPIGRLFSTVSYAQRIIFQEEQKAVHVIGNINSIHQGVEANRGRQIPAEAYHDVLYMLMHYSMAAFELLERKLTEAEKDEMVLTFSRIGNEMHLVGIPTNFSEWQKEYHRHLETNLINSEYTRKLFKEYRNHLGAFRYFLLLEIQRMTVPPQANFLLHLGKPRIAQVLMVPYRLLRRTGLHRWLIYLMIPARFKKQFRLMDKHNRENKHD